MCVASAAGWVTAAARKVASTRRRQVVRYDHDFGEPKDKLCAETSHGVFERARTKTHVIMDCNSFVANITLAGGARLV